MERAVGGAAAISEAPASLAQPSAWLVRYADAFLCSAAVLAGEALAVAFLARRELAGPHELGHALITLLPLALAAAAPLAVGGAVLSANLARADRRGARLSLAALALLLAVPVAIGISGGRLLEGARRPLFVLAMALAAAAAGYFGAGPAGRVLGKLRRRGAVLVALSAALVVALEVANAAILPRLYPAFHAGLAVLALWSAAIAAGAWWRRSARVRIGAAGAVLLASAVGIIGAPERLGGFDNLRFVYLEHAPILSQVVRASALLAPAPVHGGQAAVPRGAAGPDLRGRDVMLVTIDALRADHVGAYGYDRPTTPELDALAREGVVFEAAYTATPHTSYAVTSLMTGKYMRPLLLQGVGESSETWALALRRYGYKSAAFYPPAIFFVDRERFGAFEKSVLGFEYAKVQFSSAAERVSELESYLERAPEDTRLFVWVHLFEPHEPYVAHPSHDFGGRSIDRYDSEVAAADAGLGALVRAMRAKRPDTVVLVAADHGEEFGDHGGRYHGTTVYEEQVRVPLVVNAPGLLAARRVSEPVSLVDLMPTLLGGLRIPLSPRVRGRDLGSLLAGAPAGEGFAFAETDEQTLLAQGSLRMVCARRVGACRLFDVAADPAESRDVSAQHAERFGKMKGALASFVASLGRFERGEQRWPRALRRGIAGDAEAAMDVAALLDDADAAIRRKAAEVLFELDDPETAGHLRRALGSDEDEQVRRWCALALTRMGQGAPLALDLLEGSELEWKRLAALALAESGDPRGEDVLLAWWRSAFPGDGDAPEPIRFEHARAVAEALGRIKSEHAVGVLARGLEDVRLRVHVARALAAIDEDAARPALAAALAEERYHDARVAIARALVDLGGEAELRAPLVRFLGVPDPLPGGLGLAIEADILDLVGGPRKKELERLRRFATSGVAVGVVIPEGKVPSHGLRVVMRARATDDHPGEVRFGLMPGVRAAGDRKRPVPKRAPELDPQLAVTLRYEPSEGFVEQAVSLPPSVRERVAPGEHGDFVVYATQNVEVDACAVVPLTDELPPPPPEPWQPAD